MRVGIIGSGGVGGFYGTLLVRAGVEVHFLARSDAAILRSQGLRLLSELKGDGTVHPAGIHETAATMPPLDLLIIATKAMPPAELQALLLPLVQPGTIVLNLQNGLGREADIAAAFPETPLLGGLCLVACHRLAPGLIRHVSYELIRMSAWHRERDQLHLQRCAQLLQRVGIAIEMVPDLRQARWHKLVWNMAYNGLCTLLRADTAQVMAQPASRHLACRIMHEVAAAAQAAGHPLARDIVRDMTDITLAMPAYQPSMMLDFAAGRPMELTDIYELPLAAAQAAGCPMPATQAILDGLRQIDTARTKTS